MIVTKSALLDDVAAAVDVPEIVSCCVPALHASTLIINMIDKFRSMQYFLNSIKSNMLIHVFVCALVGGS